MPTAPARATRDLNAVRHEFGEGRGYLSACTMGLATSSTVEAMTADLQRWHSTGTPAAIYEAAVATSRLHFARLVGVDPASVAIGSQTSVMAGMIATSAPDGAEIICVEKDFTSIVTPFVQQAHRGVTVRHVPLEALAESIRESTWLVAFSLVQSANGRIADVEGVVDAASRAEAFTFCDITQAAGWLPIDADRFDATVCHTYKWLCAPRGAAFLTVRDRFARTLTASFAAWYAGDDPWQSCYGPEITLASCARRFDVSPAWQVWLGAEPALRLFASLDMGEVAAHNTALGDALCDGLGVPAHGQAIVSWADPDGSHLERLSAAGIVASGRAGCARVAFHIWNDERDVDAVLAAIR